MEIENLDHLGLVAALVDEIGLVELTDEVLAPHPLNHISPGQVVKAMILNGLGFVSAPLYLFREFFEGKPVEHLLGAGITVAHLNDDRLGRVNDNAPRLTPDQYLAWEETQPEKHEYIDGEVYAMGGGSVNHGRIAIRLTSLSRSQSPCPLTPSPSPTRRGEPETAFKVPLPNGEGFRV